MADILIRGMKMPENEPLRIVLNPNGQLFVDHGVTFTEYEAVELPEHGDLIDRDALIKTCNEIIDEDWNAKAAPYSWSYAYESFVDDIVAIPVIVSASKEETE